MSAPNLKVFANPLTLAKVLHQLNREKHFNFIITHSWTNMPTHMRAGNEKKKILKRADKLWKYPLTM